MIDGEQPDPGELHLDDYPDYTPKVLAALWKVTENGEKASRNKLVEETGLTYGKVRRACNQLADDYQIIVKHVEEGPGDPTRYYKLKQPATDVAAACYESIKLVGDVPEEPGQEEWLLVCEHLSRLRRESDGSVVDEGESLESLIDRMKRLEDEVEHLDRSQNGLHDKIDSAFAEVMNVKRRFVKNPDGSVVGRCKMCNQQKELIGEDTRFCKECDPDAGLPPHVLDERDGIPDS